MDFAPLFSVLIANYNNGCYLQEAIDSVLAQNYENWEIVIVDDKSTDDSYKIYNKYKGDGRFRVYYNEENRGVGYTKNQCVKNANGWICGFLDPDDVLVSEGALEIMIKAHQYNMMASIVYSNMYQADERLDNKIKYESSIIGVKESALETRSWPLHHFLTFKRELYFKTEGIDPCMHRAVDYDMYYKLEEVGTVVHIDDYLYMQRSNPHSLSLNDNAYKAAAWHSYACIQAMKRRGIDDESLMLFPIEAALKREYKKGSDKVSMSKIYRLGEIIVSPILLLRKIWRK